MPSVALRNTKLLGDDCLPDHTQIYPGQRATKLFCASRRPIESSAPVDANVRSPGSYAGVIGSKSTPIFQDFFLESVIISNGAEMYPEQALGEYSSKTLLARGMECVSNTAPALRTR